MCPDLIAARSDLFDAASAALGWDLVELIEQGPAERLTSTEHAQPALYVAAYGLWEAFRDVAPPPAAAAGHSLGEYTALAASGAVSFMDGLSLVARRGRAMADAAIGSNGGMVAVLGADDEVAHRVATARQDDGGYLYVANSNAPGQVVLAGGAEDLDWLETHGRDLGLRRVVRLSVGGAFHSPYMADAADRLAVALDETEFGPPSFPVYANVDAAVPEDLRDSLARQLTAPVRFRESLEAMSAEGIDTFVHIGPGDVTAGLAKRSVPGAVVHVVASLEDAATVAELLSVQ
jgi:[acyl-carrier-protein] S-malonyltransferase